MQPHQQRVVDEKAQLDERLRKLTAFTTMQNSTFAGLQRAERERLIRQHGIMNQYSVVLGERIAAFPSTDDSS